MKVQTEEMEASLVKTTAPVYLAPTVDKVCSKSFPYKSIHGPDASMQRPQSLLITKIAEGTESQGG